MSYKSGKAALNLEFTDRVPRTEYSVDCYHWPAIQAVTGIDTTIETNREKARAVGNHIPANTPLDNVLYYNEIYMKLSKR